MAPLTRASCWPPRTWGELSVKTTSRKSSGWWSRTLRCRRSGLVRRQLWHSCQGMNPWRRGCSCRCYKILAGFDAAALGISRHFFASQAPHFITLGSRLRGDGPFPWAFRLPFGLRSPFQRNSTHSAAQSVTVFHAPSASTSVGDGDAPTLSWLNAP